MGTGPRVSYSLSARGLASLVLYMRRPVRRPSNLPKRFRGRVCQRLLIMPDLMQRCARHASAASCLKTALLCARRLLLVWASTSQMCVSLFMLTRPKRLKPIGKRLAGQGAMACLQTGSLSMAHLIWPARFPGHMRAMRLTRSSRFSSTRPASSLPSSTAMAVGAAQSGLILVKPVLSLAASVMPANAIKAPALMRQSLPKKPFQPCCGQARRLGVAASLFICAAKQRTGSIRICPFNRHMALARIYPKPVGTRSLMNFCSRGFWQKAAKRCVR